MSFFGVGVEVEGGRALRRELRRAGQDMSDLKAAHAEVGTFVATEASPETPRGLTGRLADTVRSSGTQSAAVVRAGKARVPYAGPIHWGWPARNIEPQPWLATKAKETEPTWFDMYAAHIDQILDKIKGAQP